MDGGEDGVFIGIGWVYSRGVLGIEVDDGIWFGVIVVVFIVEVGWVGFDNV